MNKKYLVIIALVLVLSLALSGCSFLDGSFSVYEDIETKYNLVSQQALDDYSIDDANSTMKAASIIMPATYEVHCKVNYSYTYRYGYGTRVGTSSVEQTATAFAINQDGYLITNAHVLMYSKAEAYYTISYNSWEITVNLADSTVYFDAEVVAYDEALDLAILKMDVSDIEGGEVDYAVFYDITSPESASYGTEGAVRLYYGETAIAVGNAYGYGISVTQGVVSAPVRLFNDGGIKTHAIQTDAAINSGNSGGPLVNAFGRVIGVNSFKIADDTVDNLGYAIPSYVVLEYIQDVNNGSTSGEVLADNVSVRYYYTAVRGFTQQDINSNLN